MEAKTRSKKYSQEALLEDGSMDWKGLDKAACCAGVAGDATFDRLKHPEVRYEVTDHCNAECIMCPRDLHKQGRAHGVMNLELYKKSLDEVAALGARKIVLTGFGEPLVDKTLEDKIRCAKIKNLNTYIITNASLLTPQRAHSLIKSGLDEMRVSFYGMHRQSYNNVMKKLDFDVTMANLLRFLEMRRELGGKKQRVEISWLIMPETEADTGLFKEFWEPRVDAIEIWKPHNFGDGRSYRQRHADPILNRGKYRLLRKAHRERTFGMFPYCNQCDQLLPHADALIYTNRHNLPFEVAVRLSNTDLYDLEKDAQFNPGDF